MMMTVTMTVVMMIMATMMMVMTTMVTIMIMLMAMIMNYLHTYAENYHGSNTVFLVGMLMSVVGGVFVVFALMALCYRSVVVHKNFSLCLRLVCRNIQVELFSMSSFFYSLSLSLFLYVCIRERWKKCMCARFGGQHALLCGKSCDEFFFFFLFLASILTVFPACRYRFVTIFIYDSSSYMCVLWSASLFYAKIMFNITVCTLQSMVISTFPSCKILKKVQCNHVHDLCSIIASSYDILHI